MARIVIADDHELVRNGIQASLDGHPTLQVCGLASNGQETIDQVLELHPDLLILDLSMPVLSGYQVALKIRHLAPNVKIVVLSIHDGRLAEQVSYLMGAHGFLSKTATAQQLISTLASVLDGTSKVPSDERVQGPLAPLDKDVH
jgi:two-component system nitrate/nitrite response regulator NarL